MRGFVRIAACVALAAGLVGAPAAADEGTFVLTGTATGYVDVVVAGEREVDLRSHVKITASGRFGGFFAEQLRSNRGPEYVGRQSGQVVLRDLAKDRAYTNPMFVGGLDKLSAGVIRMYLIADGPASVEFLPGTGLPERTARPARRTAASAHVTPLARMGDMFAADVRTTLPRRALVMTALRADGPGAVAVPDVRRLCVSQVRSAECPRSLLSRAGATGDATTTTRYWLVTYRAGALKGGPHFARYAITHVSPSAPIERATGFRFVVTLA